MNCSHCEKNVATVHLTQIINGNKTQMHLCQQCASKLEQNFYSSLPLGSLFAGMLQQKVSVADTRACPVCGYTLERFAREGRLGCAQCYKEFAKELTPVIRRIHGRARHTGHAPDIRQGEGEPPAGQPAADAPQTQDTRLERLRTALQQAIQTEEYEKAAQLRDQIKAVQAGEREDA